MEKKENGHYEMRTARDVRKRLVIMNSGTVNATQYVETLKEYLIPKIDTTRHIFMQDGASAHTAKFTQEFLAEQNIRKVEWPAKSC